jgi:hypothetical protein
MKKSLKKSAIFIAITILLDICGYYLETNNSKGFIEYSYPIILLDSIYIIVWLCWVAVYKIQRKKVEWEDM